MFCIEVNAISLEQLHKLPMYENKMVERGIGGKIILIMDFKEMAPRLWTGLIWHRRWDLVNIPVCIWIPQKAGNSITTERLLAPQE
jgi:hypothetical protein